MKKTVLVLSTAVALSVMTAPAALAQESDTSCDAAKDNVTKLEKKRDDAAAEERVREKDALDAAKKAVTAAQARVDKAQKVHDETPPPSQEEIDELAAAKAELKTAKSNRNDAQDKLDKDSSKLAGLRAQVELAIQERDDACGTAETTTPTPTPTPEPENDVDCDEVGASEAQRILDADRSDPNNLDADKDGLACEVDEILPERNNGSSGDGGVVVNNNVAVPSGGVATGGGPAWAFE